MLAFDLYFADLLDRGADAIATLVRIFDAHGLVPTSFGTDPSRAAMLKRVRSAGDPLRLQLGRGSDMHCTVLVRRAPLRGSSAGTVISGELSPAAPAFPLITALASWGAPIYGLANDRAELEHVPRDRRPAPDAPLELHDIYSVNVLGKAMVDALDRRRVLATGGVKLVELPRGGVVIDAGKDPALHAALLERLRPEAEARPRRIAPPVERTWHRALSPLFDRVVERELGPDRNARITRLNELETPVTELRAPPLAANTSTPLRFHAAADDLVALLADKVEDLRAKVSRTILPALDMHFYTYDYPGTFGRAKADKLVEPLGAWLGELLVAELGGAWVPRASLDENQVVIGKTAYLPFLRARHYLATKQAVLACSLTGYVAHARRA